MQKSQLSAASRAGKLAIGLFFVTVATVFFVDYYAWSNWWYVTLGEPYWYGTLFGIVFASVLVLFDRALLARTSFLVVRLVSIAAASSVIATSITMVEFASSIAPHVSYVARERALMELVATDSFVRWKFMQNYALLIVIGAVTLLLKWALWRGARPQPNANSASQPTSPSRIRKLHEIIAGRTNVLSLIKEELDEQKKE